MSRWIGLLILFTDAFGAEKKLTQPLESSNMSKLRVTEV